MRHVNVDADLATGSDINDISVVYAHWGGEIWYTGIHSQEDAAPQVSTNIGVPLARGVTPGGCKRSQLSKSKALRLVPNH